MFSERISSLDKLGEAAEKLIGAFPGERVFAFYGKMGAGKTTFIQAVCENLGSKDTVTSPTFALINEYYAGDQTSVYHFDFYRINDLEEVFDLGYEDYVYSGSYCLIEWPEMIEPLLPDSYVEVKIDVHENNTRIISAQKV